MCNRNIVHAFYHDANWQNKLTVIVNPLSHITLDGGTYANHHIVYPFQVTNE